MVKISSVRVDSSKPIEIPENCRWKKAIAMIPLAGSCYGFVLMQEMAERMHSTQDLSMLHAIHKVKVQYHKIAALNCLISGIATVGCGLYQGRTSVVATGAAFLFVSFVQIIEAKEPLDRKEKA